MRSSIKLGMQELSYFLLGVAILIVWSICIKNVHITCLLSSFVRWPLSMAISTAWNTLMRVGAVGIKWPAHALLEMATLTASAMSMKMDVIGQVEYVVKPPYMATLTASATLMRMAVLGATHSTARTIIQIVTNMLKIMDAPNNYLVRKVVFHFPYLYKFNTSPSPP